MNILLDQILFRLETGDDFEHNAKRLLATKPPGWTHTFIQCLSDASRERAAARDLAMSAHDDSPSDKVSAGSRMRGIHAMTLKHLLRLAAVTKSAPAGSQRMRHAAQRMRQVAAFLHQKGLIAQLLWWCAYVEPLPPGRPVISVHGREAGQ